ncbi:MAG: hypothetical protein Q9217_006112 [Psora testacea]
MGAMSTPLNSLFNSALKQSSSVRRDLDAFSESPQTSPPALQGQISASLTSLARTIDDYAEMAGKELVPAKQEKAYERIKNFRGELADYRQSLDHLKKKREEAQSAQNRTELFGRRPHHAATPENPYAQSQLAQHSAFAPLKSQPLSLGASPQDYTREQHAFREQNFMSSTNAALDEYLERGRAVLGDLGQQREMLKGTQKKLYSVANTLGISGDTIRMVERRAKQDKWIFWAGVVIFFGFCWLVIHYLRRAPPPPQVEDSSSSLVDIDSQHIQEKSSEAVSQASENASRAADKTSQKGSEVSSSLKEKAAGARDYTSQKSSEVADSASTNYNEAKGATKDNAKKAEKEIKSEYDEVYENRDNPVIIANGIAIVVGAVGLAYGGYQKHQAGELDWKLAGSVAAIVGVLGVGDYYLSQYLFKNKYPKK